MVDNIQSLPVDNEQLSVEEQNVMNTFFKTDDKIHTILNTLKLPLFVGILFIIINSPQSNDFIKNVVPYARSSEASLLCFKAMLIMISIVIYHIVKNTKNI